MTLIGLAGFVCCFLVIYCIVFKVVRLPGEQGLFILNVLLSDIGTAFVAVIRGLGILSKRFVGVTDAGEVTQFCYVYPLISFIFWNSGIVVLVPLTIDRFLAIVFPLKHRVWITPSSTVVLIVLPWMLPLVKTLYLTIGVYYMENGKVG